MSPVTRLCCKCKQRLDEDLVLNTRHGYLCSSCLKDLLEDTVELLKSTMESIKPTNWIEGWYAMWCNQIWKDKAESLLKDLESFEKGKER